MAEKNEIEIVEDFLKALEAADFDAAEALLDEKVIYQNVPLPADQGKQAVLETLKRFGLIIDQFEVITHNIAANGSVVLTERTDIISGPGLRLEFWVCGTFEVKNGKITLWRDYFDWATLGREIAVSLPGFAFEAAAKLAGSLLGR